MADTTEQTISGSDAALYFANSSSLGSSGEDDDMNAEEDPGGKGNKKKSLQNCEMFRTLPIKRPNATWGTGAATGPRAVVRLTPGAKNVNP